MTISVIIPTYNGAHKVVNALAALKQQTIQNFEVIVVIDGSTDGTWEVLHQQDFGLPHLKIIQQANGGRSVSRNRGAKEAQGDILCFFDDDTRAIPNSLALHIAHHQKRPKSFLVGNVPEDTAKMQTDFQHYKAHLSRKWVAPLPTETPLNRQNLFLTAANFSTPKDLFWELGGFDERLTDAEDFDLGVRAFQQGVPVYFDIENIAWHDDFITCKTYLRRLEQYAQSHKTLMNLKPEVYTEFNQYQPQPLSWFKKSIYGLFSPNFWVGGIDKNILQFLPQTLRYKLYDIITTAQIQKKRKSFL